MFQIILTLGVHKTKITAPLDKMQEGLNTEQGGELGRGRHSSNSSCHIMGVGPSSIQWEKLPLGQRGKEQEGALRIYILFVYASTTPHD